MMTKQYPGCARRFAVQQKSAFAGSDIEHEMPLLAAIAQEIHMPGDDVTLRLTAAYRLLRNAFQSIDGPRVLKDVA